MKTITAYKCQFCGKLYQLKFQCEKHEVRCKKNPENNRPCFQCANLRKEITNARIISSDASIYIERVELLYCIERDVFLHTPINEIKGNKYNLGENENLPMPKECNLQINNRLIID